ncbi:MAG: DUF167 domain-containing protein [Armatimonadetes bacterium]|nr:DUF167 domain-containing protein [Armatimonadota bacterium]
MTTLSIKVVPRSSRTRVEWGEPVRVYVTAPPVEGEANAAVIEVLAKSLGIAKSKLSIVRGEASRNKLVSIEGIEPDEVAQRLGGRG